ncbi:urea transporter [Spirillospora sp. NBC_01491]|uniref:urea transporter n=1 Tax=Spirillospora sp. NBC_01491 TaxID=2976007 RepID=UPI002E314366|nr:urea transporter [Spirillospora sp. NBC_01491]
MRGVAQVEFISNPWTGVLFIIALFVGGWQFGVFGLLGTVVATLTAVALGIDRKRVLIGLEGFCGALIGVSLVLYLGTNWMTVVLTIAGCIAGSVLTAAMVTVLTQYNLPTFTAPFCVITTVIVVAAPTFERVWRGHTSAALPAPVSTSTTLTWSDAWHGLFNGIGQIFFQDKWYVGLIFLVGIVVASRIAAVAAVLASIVGILVGWGLGAPTESIGKGLYGYNAVLTAMALAGIFVVLTPAAGVFALVGAAAAAGLTAALTNFFTPVGGHTLTWPFVLVTWIFLASVGTAHALRRTG